MRNEQAVRRLGHIVRATAVILQIAASCTLIIAAEPLLGPASRAIPLRTPCAYRSSNLIVGDFTGNQLPDIMALCAQDGVLSISTLAGTRDRSSALSPRVVDLGGASFDYSPHDIDTVVGDFNRDGRLDLVIDLDFYVVALTAAPDGEFVMSAALVTWFEVGEISSMAAGDFNSDGELDVVALGNRKLMPLFGDGSGGLEAGPVMGADDCIFSNPNRVLAARLNRDDQDDLVLTCNPIGGAWTVTSLTGTGSGHFTTVGRVAFEPPASALGPVVTDVDSDGDADLLAPVSDDRIGILLGQGDGSFVRAGDLLGGGQRLAVADFNGDDVNDIISDAGAVFLGDGSGSFSAAERAALVGGGKLARIAALDHDGDGNSDVVQLGYDHLAVLHGDGSGTFPNPRVFPVEGGVLSMVVVDLNHDKKLDVVLANRRHNEVYAFLGTGTGDLVASPPIVLGDDSREHLIHRVLAVADLDKDGAPDIVTADGDDRLLHVLMGDGMGQFSNYPDLPLDFNPMDLAAGDLNGDGFPDLAVIGLSDTTSPHSAEGFVATFLGDGLGSFQQSDQVSSVAWLQDVVLTDFDRDGLPDIVVTDYSHTDGGLQLIRNVGNGRIHDSELLEAPFSYALHVDDVNDDDVPDLVAAIRPLFGKARSALRILLGKAQGGYAEPIDLVTPFLTQEIATGDFNRDGVVDLVTTTEGGLISLFFGNGDGNFETADQLRPAYGGAIGVGDFNSDGLPDVVTAGSESVQLLLNQLVVLELLTPGSLLNPHGRSEPVQMRLRSTSANPGRSACETTPVDHESIELSSLGDVNLGGNSLRPIEVREPRVPRGQRGRVAGCAQELLLLFDRRALLDRLDGLGLEGRQAIRIAVTGEIRQGPPFRAEGSLRAARALVRTSPRRQTFPAGWYE